LPGGQRLAVVGAAALLLLFLAAPAWAQAAHDPVVDNFEPPSLDLEIWSPVQIGPDRYRIDGTVARTGRGALAITVEAADRACEGTCQRNEIRISNRLRLAFGAGAWYGFSFQVRGDFSPDTPRRAIVGQWKDESDGSPFLAQRYTGGVFHITAQDNDCRILIARSGSSATQFLETLRTRRFSDLQFITDPSDYMCETDVEVEYGDDPILPDPYGAWVDMTYYVKGGRDGFGLIEVWANGRFVARLEGSIGNDATFGATQYFKIGIYRDPTPGSAVLYFDNFRRGASRPDVDTPE
jgi:hypothetical protein